MENSIRPSLQQRMQRTSTLSTGNKKWSTNGSVFRTDEIVESKLYRRKQFVAGEMANESRRFRPVIIWFIRHINWDNAQFMDAKIYRSASITQVIARQFLCRFMKSEQNKKKTCRRLIDGQYSMSWSCNVKQQLWNTRSESCEWLQDKQGTYLVEFIVLSIRLAACQINYTWHNVLITFAFGVAERPSICTAECKSIHFHWSSAAASALFTNKDIRL